MIGLSIPAAFIMRCNAPRSQVLLGRWNTFPSACSGGRNIIAVLHKGTATCLRVFFCSMTIILPFSPSLMFSHFSRRRSLTLNPVKQAKRNARRTSLLLCRIAATRRISSTVRYGRSSIGFPNLSANGIAAIGFSVINPSRFASLKICVMRCWYVAFVLVASLRLRAPS